MKNVTLSGSMPERNVIGRFVEKNRRTIVEVISALFILLFLYTALSKSYEITNTVVVLKYTRIFKPVATEFAWGVVIIEYIVTGLLFIPRTKKIGLYASLILMLTFTVYIISMLAFIPNLPCSCGGIISKMTWKQHLFFNLAFILLALAAILLNRKRNSGMQESENTHRQYIFT